MTVDISFVLITVQRTYKSRKGLKQAYSVIVILILERQYYKLIILSVINFIM